MLKGLYHVAIITIANGYLCLQCCLSARVSNTTLLGTLGPFRTHRLLLALLLCALLAYQVPLRVLLAPRVIAFVRVPCDPAIEPEWLRPTIAKRLPGAGCLRVGGSYQSPQLCASQPLLRRMRVSHNMRGSSAVRTLVCVLLLEELAVMICPDVEVLLAMLHQTNDRLPQCPVGLRDALLVG